MVPPGPSRRHPARNPGSAPPGIATTRIAPRPPEDPRLAPLLRAAVAELDARYPEDATDPTVEARASYLLAEVDGAPAGCAACSRPVTLAGLLFREVPVSTSFSPAVGPFA
ncbi:hypothetical protein [Georgenia sp. AZ-5]|uniref:hypothetical protein n=1 Tax=Georgenia sp. AZ-5 TaxID=3367526 RepID=UPI003754301D